MVEEKEILDYRINKYKNHIKNLITRLNRYKEVGAYNRRMLDDVRNHYDNYISKNYEELEEELENLKNLIDLCDNKST